ncbi:MAG TPA: DUF349 domain-containing protein [Vicinamibacteria bacterium]|nr:DUF349 domain-containing protein [Vicinamibacteria bacterium]
MALLDWFKPRPLWQNAEPAQRAAGVRQLGSHQQQLFADLARTDPDPRVRRAAVQRLTEVSVLAEVAGTDGDLGVRGEATELLLAAALSREDASAETALLALSESRHLVAVAKEARLASLRPQAVARLQEPRALASVAKSAESGAIRLAALEQISDPGLLAEVALKAEAKDVALAALERVTDREVWQAVAARARCKAAGRRAQAALQELARQQAEEEARAKARALAAAADAAAAALNAEAASSTPPPAPPAPAPPEPVVAAPEPAAEAVSGEPAPTTEEAGRTRLSELVATAEALAEGGVSSDTRDAVAALKSDWALAGPPPADLRTRFETALTRLVERAATERMERERAAQDNLAHLLDVCQRLEALAATQAPPLGEAARVFRESKDILDNPGRFPTKHDRDQVLARLKAARSALFPKLQELREADEWTRWANVSIQEELCGRMEALRDRQDLPAVAQESQELQERWKAARQAPKEQAEALWLRFKAARDQVKATTDAYFAERRAEQARHLEQKQALALQAEALKDSTEWVKTAAELKRLQGEWKTIGPGPRRQEAELHQRFQRACHHFFERRKSDLVERKGEWARNLEKKRALIAQVEALQESTTWEQAVADAKRLQAEWKAAGPVRRSQSEALWQRFRAACDVVFDRYQKRDQLTLAAARAACEALLSRMEGLLKSAGESGAADLADQVQALLADWRRLPELPRNPGTDLQSRFFAARDQVVAAVPAAFQGTDLDPEANRLKLEKLLAKVEALAPAEPVVAAGDLASRLKEALATNTMGGRSAEEARWQALARELEQAQAAWSRVGSAGEAGAELKRRFDDACRRVQEARKRSGV